MCIRDSLHPVGAGTTLPSDYIIHIPHEQAMVFGITADSFRCCCRTGIDGDVYKRQILTVVEDNKVDSLLDTLHKMDLQTEQVGLRAFVWNIERTI